jgi:predicted O-methyltransferase YrrM
LTGKARSAWHGAPHPAQGYPNMFADETASLDLARLFPVNSQTSPRDKIFLLAAREFVGETRGRYAYLEIGSYLGGSLAPFLTDERCTSILSIDERGRLLPDERGAAFDYAGVTAATMVDKLHGCGLDTAKLETFDGSIETLGPRSERYDLAFIDGEHTDEACFRDFLWTLPLLKEDSVVLFHDSTLVYRALKLIGLYLRSTKRAHVMFKGRDSEMSAILFGERNAAQLAEYFGEPDDLPAFYDVAEAKVLTAQVRNRVRYGFDRRKLIGIKIKPPKIKKIS